MYIDKQQVKKMNFQHAIKQALKKSGLTDTEFREKLGISHATLWRWKNGVTQPRPDAIEYWINKLRG